MSVIIQIFGTKKCRETQKAIRYFKERNIAIQFINLEEIRTLLTLVTIDYCKQP
ncbi:MAG: hypothetical protein KGZ71_01680 [Desulfobulbaceae bacterium]|nr:hypothetical protein [Desulfobulbaceae bacterium]